MQFSVSATATAINNYAAYFYVVCETLGALLVCVPEILSSKYCCVLTVLISCVCVCVCVCVYCCVVCIADTDISRSQV